MGGHGASLVGLRLGRGAGRTPTRGKKSFKQWRRHLFICTIAEFCNRIPELGRIK